MDRNDQHQGQEPAAMGSRPVGNLESTQTRNGQRTLGGAGGGIESGNPDEGGNRSGGQGDASKQSAPASESSKPDSSGSSGE